MVILLTAPFHLRKSGNSGFYRKTFLAVLKVSDAEVNEHAENAARWEYPISKLM